uniref:WSC domain-containing protein n=1 Tax=Macrostomum lignano TaxID=282301 RepID=A0A1I8GWZ5_9PLAT
MKAWNDSEHWAEYSSFSVGPESDNYRLSVSGFSGSAGIGDSLARSNDFQFTTKDADHDVHSDNCGSRYFGAWWFADCHNTHPNGQYRDFSSAIGGPRAQAVQLVTFNASSGLCAHFRCRLGLSHCRKCRNANKGDHQVWTAGSDCWTTVQHRVSGSVDFYRNWTQYQSEFGEGPDGNYWIAYKGAWWFTSCHCAHLNGEYKDASAAIGGAHAQGVIWKSNFGYDYSLMEIEMLLLRWAPTFIAFLHRASAQIGLQKFGKTGSNSNTFNRFLLSDALAPLTMQASSILPLLCCCVAFGYSMGAEFGPMGCFVDGPTQDLPGLEGRSTIGPYSVSGSFVSLGHMTLELCSEICAYGDFEYFGIQFSVECFCGNSYGSLGQAADSDCNMNCGGNSAQICGSEWRNSVYRQVYLRPVSRCFTIADRVHLNVTSSSGPFYRTEQPVMIMVECLIRCRADCQAVLFHLDTCYLLRFQVVPHELKAVTGEFAVRMDVLGVVYRSWIV